MSNMSIKTFLAVAMSLPANTSLLLRSNHGMGKSQLGRQLATLIARREKLDEFPVIDRRLSQVSEGDIIGLPSTDGNVTRFNPPDWYKQACNQPCFLFLDELNRATPEVMQAAFQIVLDRELNGWKLHPQTRVMSAVNLGASYVVNEMDPALLDRFFVVDLCPTVEEWLEWAQAKVEDFGGEVIEFIVDFIRTNNGFLDPPKNCEPNSVQPSRRSWDRLSKALKADGIDEKPENELFYAISTGFVGTEASIAFVAHAKTLDYHFTGEELVNDYASVAKKLRGKRRHELILSAIDKIGEYMNAQADVTEQQCKNVAAFLRDLHADEGELKMSMWKKLMSNGLDNIERTKKIHKEIMPIILVDVFQVTPGETGTGKLPNIPAYVSGKIDEQPAPAPTPEPAPEVKTTKKRGKK
jgi:hypothetical protein